MSSLATNIKSTRRPFLNEVLSTIEMLLEKGGPDPEDYEFLTVQCQSLNESNLSLTQQHSLYEVLQPLLNVNTMIGFSYTKPHGYSGDFEQIDRIYNQWTNPDSNEFFKWDAFYHNLSAATAVRNRKEYIQKELVKLENQTNPKVLNLGSGPCSDIEQYLNNFPQSKIKFDCLDMDENAIAYGMKKCEKHKEKINFLNVNAFRFKPDYQYDLIWSAGLFDYFKDKLFSKLVEKYYKQVNKGGKLVIGNFAESNESKGVMELFGQWYLHHRSEESLISLANLTGIDLNKISIESEKTGVNKFLHIEK